MHNSIDHITEPERTVASFQELCYFGRLAPVLSQLTKQHEEGQLEHDMYNAYTQATDLLNKLLDLDLGSLATQIVDMIDHEDVESIRGSYFDAYAAIDTIIRIKSDERDDISIGSAQQKARKNFALGVINRVNTIVSNNDLEGADGNSRLISDKLNLTILGGSPNMMDYVGGLDDQIDIAVAAQEVPGLERAVREVRESAMQSITFSHEPKQVQEMFATKVASSTPLRQLEILKFYDALSHQATDVEYGNGAAQVLENVFQQVAGSNNALTGIVAEQYRIDTLQRRQDGTSFTGDEAAKLTRYEEFGLKNHVYLPKSMQERHRPAHVALDTIGVRDGYGIIRQVAHVEGIPDTITEQEIYLTNASNFLARADRARYPEEFFIEAKQFLETRLDEDAAQQISQSHDIRELTATVNHLLSGYYKSVIRLEKTDLQALGVDDTLNDDEIRLLQIVHTPAIREALEMSTGVRLSDVSLHTQTRLLRYMVQQSPEGFARLTNAAEMVKNTVHSTSQFYEAFLATEFGDDFGDKILSIAEHATPEQAATIFESINSYREESVAFAKMFEAYDPGLARATERAMNERLTDMLTIAEHVARGGAVTVDTAPHRDRPDYVHDGRFDLTTKSVDHVITVTNHYLDSQKRRHEIIDAPDTVVSRVVANQDDMGYQIYRFHNKHLGDVLLHIRPEGAGVHDRSFEYGNYDGVEATISWVVNPTGNHMLASDKDPNGVSIRFDREGRRVDEAPNSPDRTPVRDDGTMSLDISSGLGKASTVPVQIGRMLAAGNILRSQKQGTKVSLHHNTNYFDQEKYGSSEGFKKLAEYMQAMAEVQIRTQRLRKSGRRAVVATAA